MFFFKWKVEQSESVCINYYTLNLSGTYWIELFDLWGLPINSFNNYTKFTSPSTNISDEKFYMCLKNKFPDVYSESVKKCSNK